MVSKTFFIVTTLCLCQALAKPLVEVKVEETFTQKLAIQIFILNVKIEKTLLSHDIKISKQINDILLTGAIELAGKLSDILEAAKVYESELNEAVEFLKTKVQETIRENSDIVRKTVKLMYIIYQLFVFTVAHSPAQDTDMKSITDNIDQTVILQLKQVNAEIQEIIDKYQQTQTLN